jgi:hypothetical protein
MPRSPPGGCSQSRYSRDRRCSGQKSSPWGIRVDATNVVPAAMTQRMLETHSPPPHPARAESVFRRKVNIRNSRLREISVRMPCPCSRYAPFCLQGSCRQCLCGHTQSNLRAPAHTPEPTMAGGKREPSSLATSRIVSSSRSARPISRMRSNSQLTGICSSVLFGRAISRCRQVP